ncbi:MAG: methyltransferase domain-containing protein [Firmicutes bacterium]|nr:methyltransferase domain-containing protein [Bacillota bacterium]
MVVLNDLFDYGLKIYQDENKFKFSLDSLLLAEFTNIKKSDKKLLDLCSGNAPLPLILASKHDIEITGVEIQKDINDLAEKSVKYNNLESKIEMLNINAQDTKKYFSRNSFDLVTCNPPFFKINENSKLNESIEKRIARHEVTITLEEIIEIASYNLKDNGSFYMVHRPERLEEIINYASKNNLHVKEIEFIYSNNEDYAIMVLLKFIKKAKIGVKIGSRIINRDTKTYQNIFNRKV